MLSNFWCFESGVFYSVISFHFQTGNRSRPRGKRPRQSSATSSSGDKNEEPASKRARTEWWSSRGEFIPSSYVCRMHGSTSGILIKLPVPLLIIELHFGWHFFPSVFNRNSYLWAINIPSVTLDSSECSTLCILVLWPRTSVLIMVNLKWFKVWGGKL